MLVSARGLAQLNAEGVDFGNLLGHVEDDFGTDARAGFPAEGLAAEFEEDALELGLGVGAFGHGI